MGKSNDANNYLLQDFYSLQMGLYVPSYINTVNEIWISELVRQ